MIHDWRTEHAVSREAATGSPSRSRSPPSSTEQLLRDIKPFVRAMHLMHSTVAGSDMFAGVLCRPIMMKMSLPWPVNESGCRQDGPSYFVRRARPCHVACSVPLASSPPWTLSFMPNICLNEQPYIPGANGRCNPGWAMAWIFWKSNRSKAIYMKLGWLQA